MVGGAQQGAARSSRNSLISGSRPAGTIPAQTAAAAVCSLAAPLTRLSAYRLPSQKISKPAKPVAAPERQEPPEHPLRDAHQARDPALTGLDPADDGDVQRVGAALAARRAQG